MKCFSKLAVLFLLAAVGANSPMALGVPLSTGRPQRPAGCHEHGSKTPAPEPVSYQCCQAGHDLAILQASSISQPIGLRCSRGEVACHYSVRVTGFSAVVDPPEFSSDPPGVAPLRI